MIFCSRRHIKGRHHNNSFPLASGLTRRKFASSTISKISSFFLFFVLLLLCSSSSTKNKVFVHAQVNKCTLCADGSAPNLSLESDSLQWTCSNLAVFADILIAGEQECIDLQFAGFWDCECPTYPENYCTLCPGGSNEITNPDFIVPSNANLTCRQILYVDENRLDSCEELAPFRSMCGCPTDVQCSFCTDGTVPTFGDRIIPYLTTSENPVTCASNAAKAFSAPPATCEDYTIAPVPVNGQAYCGCQGTAPLDLCTLCPEGTTLVNPELDIPRTGLNCREMQEYLRYVTEEESCNAIASMGRPCCQPLEPCPVCPQGPNVEFERELSYPPYQMTCETIGLAEQFGYKMGCSDVQQRFPYYCGCPGSQPACTLCPLGQIPPLERDIPLLQTTCSEVNAYASLRLASECAEEMASLRFDASAYCGCTGFLPPDDCPFCRAGQIVRDLALVPPGADQPCEILADFARYVTRADLCTAVQEFAPACCDSPTGPTTAPAPTINDTNMPTPTFFSNAPSLTPSVPTSFPPVFVTPTPNPPPASGAVCRLSATILSTTATMVIVVFGLMSFI